MRRRRMRRRRRRRRRRTKLSELRIALQKNSGRPLRALVNTRFWLTTIVPNQGSMSSLSSRGLSISRSEQTAFQVL